MPTTTQMPQSSSVLGRKRWDCSSVSRASDWHTTDTGPIPWCSKGFFSQSQLSVQTLSQCPHSPVCNRMHSHNICAHVKDPVVHVRVLRIMETLKYPCMHHRLGITTLSQLAFPGESNPNFQQEESKWENHHHHHLSLNRDGRWCTTDDFITSFLHSFLSSTALWDLANSRPVHSLMLSSHLFPCLPCLLCPFTVPCKMVLARPDERETWPYHCSLHLFTIIRRSSCGPIVCWILARTSSLVTWSLYEMCSI